MATYNLYRWAVCNEYTSSYSAPEQGKPCLRGFRNEDKKEVITSFIVSVNGREVTTNSGSLYILEDIDPNYLDWIIKNGYEYNSDNPIKFLA